MSFKNTIWAGGLNSVYGQADTFTAPLEALTTVKPGNLVMFDSSEELTGTLGNAGEINLVVLEGGEHLGESVDTTYEGGTVVEAAFPRSGELFNLLVPAALATVKGAQYSGDFNTSLKQEDAGTRGNFIAMETTAASAQDRLVLFKAI